MMYISGNRINSTRVNKDLGILTVLDMINLANLKFGYKFLHNLLPRKVAECCRVDSRNNCLMPSHEYNTRSRNIPNLPKSMNKNYQNCYLTQGPRSIIKIDVETRLTNNLHRFAKICKNQMIKKILIFVCGNVANRSNFTSN